MADLKEIVKLSEDMYNTLRTTGVYDGVDKEGNPVHLVYDESDSIYVTPVTENLHTYSTEEQIVGTWINGKPIYERTMHYSSFNLSSDISFNYIDENGGNITIDLDALIDVKASVKRLADSYSGNKEVIEPLPNSHYEAKWSMAVNDFSNSGFYLTVGSNVRQFTGGLQDLNITIQYTKTTD